MWFIPISKDFVATVSNEADQQCGEIHFGGAELTTRALKSKYIHCGDHHNAEWLEHENQMTWTWKST